MAVVFKITCTTTGGPYLRLLFTIYLNSWIAPPLTSIKGKRYLSNSLNCYHTQGFYQVIKKNKWLLRYDTEIYFWFIKYSVTIFYMIILSFYWTLNIHIHIFVALIFKLKFNVKIVWMGDEIIYLRSFEIIMKLSIVYYKFHIALGITSTKLKTTLKFIKGFMLIYFH